MRKPLHRVDCRLVTMKDQSERFYMDMSVYEVRPVEFEESGEGEESTLLWRGLYLAVDTGAARKGLNPLNPFLNFWN